MICLASCHIWTIRLLTDCTWLPSWEGEGGVLQFLPITSFNTPLIPSQEGNWLQPDTINKYLYPINHDSTRRSFISVEKFIEEYYLIVNGIAPIVAIMRTRADNEVVVDLVFQQLFMEIVIYFKEEITVTTIKDQS